jgi:hypothetical protein
LAANTEPGPEFEVREKFREWSFINGLADESAERMHLASVKALALAFDIVDVLAEGMNEGGPLSHGFEIDFQGAIAIERAQGTDAVPEASQEGGKIGAMPAFEVGGCEEFHLDAGDGFGMGGKAQGKLAAAQWGQFAVKNVHEERNLLPGGKTASVEVPGAEH